MSDLNLARKWRPKNFDEIVGQDLSIRMIKNGLYLNKLFPVYLFSGQRGCGKTSTARVFAAAVNCSELNEFRKEPKKHIVPCGKCDSCKNILSGQHPDFIEMDAASHTGVDSVRQIIESCAYMPVSGAKKIYLIDEAHMLSKAAFNAFLKILEEPPASVLFILATTEMQKIPDTVRSRCFQAFFTPVTTLVLKKHILDLSKKEDIVIDDDAVELILQESEGSVRDAINVLERIRFLSDHITKEIVLKSLGKISDEQILHLTKILFDQKPKDLLKFLQTINFFEMSPQNLWAMVVTTCRSLLWLKYDVKTISYVSKNFVEGLKKIESKCSINRLNAILQILWTQEELFLRTPNKHLFLENVLLQICQQVNVADLDELIELCKKGGGLQDDAVRRNPSTGSGRTGFDAGVEKKAVRSEAVHPEPVEGSQRTETAQEPKPSLPTSEPWNNFLQKVETIQDQLLTSIFKQASFATFDKSSQKVSIQLRSKNELFVDKINEQEKKWLPLLQEAFSNASGFSLEEMAEQKKKIIESKVVPEVNKKPKPYSYKPSYNSFSNNSRGEMVDISDKEKWPTANLITKYFSGNVEKVKE